MSPAARRPDETAATAHPAVEVATPALYHCTIRHVRTEPVRHSFRHATHMWLIDLDEVPRLPGPFQALARFEARDHFGGSTPTIRAGLDRFLAARDVDLAGGRVLMLAHPRRLGHVFNPLTLFWCHRPGGDVACVVAEVHNTYGERHCYLVHPDEQGRAGTAKCLYVSPFLPEHGQYRMHLPVPGADLAVTVRHEQHGRPLLVASVQGRRRPATLGPVLRATLRQPWPTVALAARIRIEGLRLLVQRRLPVYRRPVHPTQEGME